jgi:hypothetical protein
MSVPVASARSGVPDPSTVVAPPLQLGSPRDDRLHQLTAMLAVAGPDAVVSHASAAHLYGFGGLVPWRAEISYPRCDRYRVRKVRAHRSLDLGADDTTELFGVRVTTVARMLVDLSGRCSEWVLLELFDRAVAQERVTYGQLASCCERLRQAPGRRRSVVRSLLDRRAPGSPAISALALRTQAAARVAGLPPFAVDHAVATRRGVARVALAYPESQIAVVGEPATLRVDPDVLLQLDAVRNAGWRLVAVRWTMSDADIVTAIGSALTRRA